jgi:BirA family biotin operon repressor/biotin-[acetyl-CoA-carboxylase] ligase
MLALPPGFGALPCGNDPWAAAMRGAAAGDDPGSIRWDHADGVLRLAIVLAPDRPMQDAGPVAGLGALALFDALATLAPPQVPMHLLARDGLVPDGLAVDGARVAAIRAAMAPALLDAVPDAVPDWAVLGFEVALQARTAEPGATPDRTSLHEEGFGDVTAADVLVNTLRHLLVWLDAWGQDGAAALAPATLQRMMRQAVPA